MERVLKCRIRVVKIAGEGPRRTRTSVIRKDGEGYAKLLETSVLTISKYYSLVWNKAKLVRCNKSVSVL